MFDVSLKIYNKFIRAHARIIRRAFSTYFKLFQFELHARGDVGARARPMHLRDGAAVGSLSGGGNSTPLEPLSLLDHRSL